MGTGSISPAGRGDGSADTGVSAKTPAEQRADLDGKLDASLGRFDEQLRREQQRTAAERDTRATARADGAAVDAADAADGEAGNGKPASDDIRRDRAGDLKSDGVQRDSPDGTGTADGGDTADVGAGSTPSGGGGRNGKPIPSGQDDDIVARRLRRAAENETDPELKEKLWNEYRDYKENTKASK